MANASALILAGGKSSRFGRDKTLATLDGVSLVERAAAGLRPLFDEILIASNAQDKFRIPDAVEVADVYPDAGPLGGIHSGLVHSKNDALFVMACDMPNFSAALCKKLLAGSVGYDAFIPRAGEEIEPLFGVYRKSALPAVEAMLENRQYKVRTLFSLIKTGYLPLDHIPGEDNPFFNINHAADYERLLRKQDGR